MMWKPSVNAICDRAHGTGSTASDVTCLHFRPSMRCSPTRIALADDGERRVHRTDTREEARVDNVEVVDLVRLAVGVQAPTAGIVAEAGGTGLVRDAGHRDAHVHVEVLPSTWWSASPTWFSIFFSSLYRRSASSSFDDV